MTRRTAALIVILAACGGGSTSATTTTSPASTSTASTSTVAPTTTVPPTTTTTLVDGPVDVFALRPYPLLMSSFGPGGVGPVPDAGLTMALVVVPRGPAAPPGTASGAGVSTVVGVFGAATGFDADCLGFTLWAEDFSSRYVDGYAPLTDAGCGDPGGPVVPDSQVLLVAEQTVVVELGALPGGSFAPSFQVQNSAGDAGFYSIGQDLFVDPEAVPVLAGGLVVAFGGDLLDAQGSTFRTIQLEPWPAGDCTPDETSLCFGRFLVSSESLADGEAIGSGTAVPLGAAHEGGFRFGTGDALDVIVKLVNGCAVNDRIWVLVAPLTPIATTVTVIDVTLGLPKTYPSTSTFEPVVDTEAFATCP